MLLSEIYDGEVFDSNVVPKNWKSVEIYEYTKDNLIPQEGEIVREICEIKPARLFKAPNGETVIDFGQEFSGYVRFKVCGRPGDICDLDHAEVLDAEGNFYTENLRPPNRTSALSATAILRIPSPFHLPGFQICARQQLAGGDKP